MQGVSTNRNGNKPLSGSNIDLFLALQKIALLSKKNEIETIVRKNTHPVCYNHSKAPHGNNNKGKQKNG